jgi:hypothetical protein
MPFLVLPNGKVADGMRADIIERHSLHVKDCIEWVDSLDDAFAGPPRPRNLRRAALLPYAQFFVL